MDEDALRGMLWGAAIGDALGAPHEFRTGTPLRKYTGLLEFPLVRQNQWQGRRVGVVGQVSDDTEMGLALADALAAARRYDSDRVVEAYLAWANSKCPFMGRNTRALLHGVKTLRGYRGRYKKVVEDRPLWASSQSNGAPELGALGENLSKNFCIARGGARWVSHLLDRVPDVSDDLGHPILTIFCACVDRKRDNDETNSIIITQLGLPGIARHLRRKCSFGCVEVRDVLIVLLAIVFARELPVLIVAVKFEIGHVHAKPVQPPCCFEGRMKQRLQSCSADGFSHACRAPRAPGPARLYIGQRSEPCVAFGAPPFQMDTDRDILRAHAAATSLAGQTATVFKRVLGIAGADWAP
jgi:hypothetical protein